MRLSSHDASFLYTETASGPMHSTGISVLDGPATYEELFDYMAARIHLVPRFRQKLAFVPFNIAHPVWVDDADFDLANHYKRYQVEPNTTIEEAITIGLKLGEKLLDRSRPLWLTYIMEGVEGKTVTVQMSHHAFVDGATGVAMATVLSDPTPDAVPPPPEEGGWQPAPEPTPMALWREAMQENAAADWKRTQQGFGVPAEQQDPEFQQKLNDLMTRMSREVMQAPWNAGLVGPKRAIASRIYPFEEFRPIRAALGGTVNDIVVAVVSEGAARYMKSKGEMVDDQYIRLMCPVNVRAPGDDPLVEGGNRVSAMFPVLPAWPMKIVDRLAAVREEMDGMKARGEAETLDRMQGTQPDVPPVQMASTLGVGTPWDPTAMAARWPTPIAPHPAGTKRPQQTGFNFTCTNVAGLPEKRYTCGYSVSEAYGTMMLGGNLGLGVAVGSNFGEMGFGFTSDPRLLPDIQTFADFVAEAYEELKAAAKSPAKPMSEPKAKSKTKSKPKSKTKSKKA